MKTLAFLIDEIDHSKELIRFAALLGKDINAKVHVLHVQNPSTLSAYGQMGAMIQPDPQLHQKMGDEIKVKVPEFIREIEAELTGTAPIAFSSENGDATTILKEKVESKTFDMVMLYGDTEDGYLLQNSVIMEIIHNVSCPVWIIPPDAEYQPMKKIIYATDYNEEDISTLERLIAIVKSNYPEIMALHISNDDEFEKKLKNEGFAVMLSKKVDYNKVSVRMIPDEKGKDAVESLVDVAEKLKANLIVVLKDNKNFFERLFKSSFTAKIVRSAKLPILVFHKES